MEKMNNNGGKFSSGFVFGLIIGALIVFLLATKKGRKVLKIISEEGLELSEFFEEEEEIAPKKKAKTSHSVQVQEINNTEQFDNVQNTKQETTEPVLSGNGFSKPSSPRRFFRGIPKR